MHVKDLRQAMDDRFRSHGLGPTFYNYERAAASVIAFLTAPLPTCACGMFRAGQTFHNWHKTCPVNQSGEHAPVPRY